MMNVPGILFYLSIIFFCVLDVQAQSLPYSQIQDSIPILSGDSIQLLETDSVSTKLQPEKEKRKNSKQDTIAVKRNEPSVEITSDKFFAPSYMFSPSPRKAVIYSAIFPGLGQIYNRQYWKLPILYGGFAGLAYAISWNNGYYRDYLGAYKDIMDDNPTTNRWQDLLPYGVDAESVDTQWFTGVLQQRKDRYRYYRDLSVIISVGVYLLAIVDAYVDAQLFDFDMGTDLSMRIAPAMINSERGINTGSSSFGIQCSLNF